MPVTVYVQTLDQTSVMLNTAQFSGTVIPLPTDINAFGIDANLPLDNVKNLFKFYIEDVNGGDTINYIGVPKISSNVWDTTGSLEHAEQDWMDKLAGEVFGSTAAVGLFNNNLAVRTEFKARVGECDTLVGSSTSSESSTEVIEGLLADMYGNDRFAVNYMVANDTAEPILLSENASLSGVVSAGTYPNISVFAAPAGATAVDSGALVTVVVGDNQTISSITVTNPATTIIDDGSVVILPNVGGSGNDVTYTSSVSDLQLEIYNLGAHTNTDVAVYADNSPTGALTAIEYGAEGAILRITVATHATTPIAAGASVSFVHALGTDKHLSLTSPNSVQLSAMNGTLGDTGGTAAPLEVGDKIQLVYTINSHADQPNAAGDTVTVEFKSVVTFTITQ